MPTQSIFSGGLEKWSATSNSTKNNTFSADTVGVCLIRKGNFHDVTDYSEATANWIDQNIFSQSPFRFLASRTSSVLHQPVLCGFCHLPETHHSLLSYPPLSTCHQHRNPRDPQKSKSVLRSGRQSYSKVVASSNEWKLKLDKFRLALKPKFQSEVN